MLPRPLNIPDDSVVNAVPLTDLVGMGKFDYVSDAKWDQR